MDGIMNMLSKILCFIGLHKWEYKIDNKIFPFIPYAYCKRCGKIKANW